MYMVKIVDQDGVETPVHARLKAFKSSLKDSQVCVCVTWCKREITEDPHAYIAITEAWPGEDSMSIVIESDTGEIPRFTGVINHVSWDHENVTLSACDGEHQPITMTITGDVTDPTGMHASITVDNHGAGEVAIDFGDDTPNEMNPGDGTTVTTHIFEPGIATVTATDVDRPDRTVSQVVTVPFPNPEQDMVVTINVEPSDPTRHVGVVIVDNKGNGPVVVAFGDGTVANNAGNGTTPTVHAWMAPGTYTVTTTDVDQPWRHVIQTVTIPFA